MGKRVLVAYEDRRRAAKAAKEKAKEAPPAPSAPVIPIAPAALEEAKRLAPAVMIQRKQDIPWREVYGGSLYVVVGPKGYQVQPVKGPDTYQIVGYRVLVIEGPHVFDAHTFNTEAEAKDYASDLIMYALREQEIKTGRRTFGEAREAKEDCGCGGKAKEEPVVAPVPGPLVGGAEERGITTDVGTTCKPFTRIERDPALFQACMIRAKQIGEFKDSRSFYELVAPEIVKRDSESFYVVCIDFRGQLRDFVEVAIGQRHKVGVDVEDILAIVILSKCDGFAIAHCHPSGHAAPSDADKKLTKLVRDAAAVACPNIPLVDHLIVGLNEAYSFTDKKLHRYK